MAMGFIAPSAVAEQPERPHKTVPEELSPLLQGLQRILRTDRSFRRLLAAELLLRTIHPQELRCSHPGPWMGTC